MRGTIATFILLLASTAAPAWAADVSSESNCRIVSGEKLLTGSGGGSAVCAAIEKAIAQAAPMTRYRAEVKVLSPNRLAATLIVDGKVLPQQNFAVMDDALKPATIARFAKSIAARVAEAAKP